jgi:hypothetical protein
MAPHPNPHDSPGSDHAAAGSSLAEAHITSRVQLARAFAVRCLPSTWRRRILLLTVASSLSLLLLFLPGALFYHVYFDWTGLPDLGPFIRFEPPTTGRVYDRQGKVLIEIAREYREVVSSDEVPTILR